MGIFGGYNWLIGNDWLAGIEGSINVTGAKKDEKIDESVFQSTNDSYELRQNWEASLVAHFGKLVGESSYLYGLGGISWTRLQGRFTGPDENSRDYDGWQSDTVAGWTVGAGWEMKLSGNWHIRLEYRHSQYNDAKFTHTEGFEGMNYVPIDAKVDYKTDTVMLGVSYRF